MSYNEEYRNQTIEVINQVTNKLCGGVHFTLSPKQCNELNRFWAKLQDELRKYAMLNAFNIPDACIKDLTPEQMAELPGIVAITPKELPEGETPAFALTISDEDFNHMLGYVENSFQQMYYDDDWTWTINMRY